MNAPVVEAVPFPTDRGAGAMDWLSSQGLAPRPVTIRSSDYSSLRSCPFSWYLSRRLGLVPALKHSTALNRGTWAHISFALLNNVNAEELYQNAIAFRVDELKSLLKHLQFPPNAVTELVREEEEDAITAREWFKAALHVPFGSLGSTLETYLKKFSIVQSEPTISVGDTTIQPDKILCYPDAPTKHWVVDYKTCSESPIQRLQTCPVEFQTLHYFHVYVAWLRANKPGHTCEGVLHVAQRKPDIKYGQNDRPFTLDTTPLKSGPRKGQPKNERIYFDEKRPELYGQRCMDWFLGVNEYEHLAAERAADPCVNISTTPAGLLNSPDKMDDNYLQLAFCRNYHARAPHPGNFEKGEPSGKFNQPNRYLPFMVSDVGLWPSIVQRENFVQKDRE